MPVILRKFHENPSRLRQLSVIKKTKKFSKIGKIDKKLLKSSKNCYTGNIFKATKKTSRERLRSGVPKAAFRSLRRSGARLSFDGGLAHIDLFADPV